MRSLSEMVLVIVGALVFLSAAFTIRPVFPVAASAVLSTPTHGKAFRRSAPMPPAGPVLAPVPDPAPPRVQVPESEPSPLPPRSEAKFHRL